MEDFWRMMWEDRVPTIVMLTRVFEGKVSVDRYTPAFFIHLNSSMHTNRTWLTSQFLYSMVI